MDIDADGEKESPDEDKGVNEALGSAQVGQLKVDADSQKNDKHGSSSGLQGSGSLQMLPQQLPPQGTGVCWERFLHVRSIRVLLVENDDSTRHVVTALLRNCNYEVLDAANGLQAWRILEDLNNHVDIVLTEVVMPCVSGVTLLCKIMSHKTRKNIPVIMMSSHDSMGLVFKCLSKGAVDFLVKPIRKNELKNLWQHVWRRCHSSSGSGSESGTQTQKSVKSKGTEKSCNGSSDDGENDVSNGLNIGDGSDDGSGAQSSWTKQPVEVDSSQGLSPMDQVAECQDSTCAQVIRSNAEHSDKKKMQIRVAREGCEQNQHDIVEKGKDLEAVVDMNVIPKSENLVEALTNLTSKDSEPTRDVANQLDINNSATDECKEPHLELSLKRVRGVQDTGRSVQDERYVLRRSEQSAFSRYNTPTNIFKTPNVITGSNSIFDNGIEVAKRESVGDMQVCSTEHYIHQSSNGVSNNIDMGSTTNKLKDKSEASSAMNGVYPPAFGLVKNDIKLGQQQFGHLANDKHFSSVENQPSSNHEKLAAEAPHCGSTNVLGGLMDGSQRNYSLNRSNSGSNHGSNGQNGSSTAINAMGNNAESDVGQAGKSGSGSGDASGSGNRVDESKLAPREAALLKFRQKRKERCFKKRVRYQNRKKLAEQRPRVRGQFVKQTGRNDGSGRVDDE